MKTEIMYSVERYNSTVVTTDVRTGELQGRSENDT